MTIAWNIRRSKNVQDTQRRTEYPLIAEHQDNASRQWEARLSNLKNISIMKNIKLVRNIRNLKFRGFQYCEFKNFDYEEKISIWSSWFRQDLSSLLFKVCNNYSSWYYFLALYLVQRVHFFPKLIFLTISLAVITGSFILRLRFILSLCIFCF